MVFHHHRATFKREEAVNVRWLASLVSKDLDHLHLAFVSGRGGE